MKPSITFIIPTYNDQDSIESLVNSVHTVAKKSCSTYEIVILNDASTDSTPTILSSLANNSPNVRIVTHKVNQGYGVTIYELYHLGKLPWMFSLPGDFQIDPNEVTKLIPHMSKADLILGRRIDRKETLFRRVQTRTYNTLLRILFGLKTHDVNTVRLMKRDVIQHISLLSKSAFVDAELVIKTNRKGYKVIEIPISHKPRETGGATGGSITRTIVPTIIDMVHLWPTLQKKI